MKANKEIDGEESEDLIGIKAGDAMYEVYKLQMFDFFSNTLGLIKLT